MEAYEKTKVNPFKACEVQDNKRTACACERIPGETYRRGIFMGPIVILNVI
jgi:hypothetical protein